MSFPLIPARLQLSPSPDKVLNFDGVTTIAELQGLFGACFDVRSGKSQVCVYLCDAFDRMPVRVDLGPATSPFIGSFGLDFDPELDPHAVIASSAKKAIEIGNFCLARFKDTPPSPSGAVRSSPFRFHEV